MRNADLVRDSMTQCPAFDQVTLNQPYSERRFTSQENAQQHE
jgi:hypothetical protein